MIHILGQVGEYMLFQWKWKVYYLVQDLNSGNQFHFLQRLPLKTSSIPFFKLTQGGVLNLYSTYPIDGDLTGTTILVKLGRVVMAIKEYTFPKAPGLEPHHLIVWCNVLDTCFFIPLLSAPQQRDKKTSVGVFYSSSWWALHFRDWMKGLCSLFNAKSF